MTGDCWLDKQSCQTEDLRRCKHAVCVHRLLLYLLAEGENKKQEASVALLYRRLSSSEKSRVQINSSYLGVISENHKPSPHQNQPPSPDTWIKLHKHTSSPLQTRPALRHSHSLRLPPSDVRLRQVSVHLRPGQEEALLPAAATLPGQQTGSGIVPEQDDQSHLQTLPEETVHEERRPWVAFCIISNIIFLFLKVLFVKKK